VCKEPNHQALTGPREVQFLLHQNCTLWMPIFSFSRQADFVVYWRWNVCGCGCADFTCKGEWNNESCCGLNRTVDKLAAALFCAQYRTLVRGSTTIIIVKDPKSKTSTTEDLWNSYGTSPRVCTHSATITIVDLSLQLLFPRSNARRKYRAYRNGSTFRPCYELSCVCFRLFYFSCYFHSLYSTCMSHNLSCRRSFRRFTANK
jgi:hypothetical protein